MNLSNEDGGEVYESLGAIVREGGVHFRVWAPKADSVAVVLQPDSAEFMMRRIEGGYFETVVPDCTAGTCYHFRMNDGELLPDPASRFQPAGVHGPSQVDDPAAFDWQDIEWPGVARHELVIYELHVGTFTPSGTFRGALEKLAYLKSLGVTAIELMPVAAFAGRWNWGYDSVALFAPFHGYGTPDDLRELVNAAHQAGIAVLLDVVYNHFGPDGCYAVAYGKFFSDKHRSTWGQGVNLDDVDSEGVRNFFIQNVIHWLRDYHFDGLRLDATHTLNDESPTHFLSELSKAVEQLPGPKRFLIAEDSRNLADLVRPRHAGGHALDGIWSDDFHHQIRNLVTGDSESYFHSFADSTAYEIAECLQRGWYFAGQITNKTTEKARGTNTEGVALDHFVICIQNHDQIGNRPTGARINHEIAFPMYRALSALLLFAPETPLLFMGQEWAATTPFRFFTDHREELGELITAGRKEEFQGFAGFQGEVPDPQDPATFEHSKLDWTDIERPLHLHILQLYRDLLILRTTLRGDFDIRVHGDRAMTLCRGQHQLILSLAEELTLPIAVELEVLLQTEDSRYSLDAHAPVREGGAVFFPVPGAILGIMPSV